MKFASQHNKNQIKLEKQKIIFQFSLVTIAALMAGIFFLKMLSYESITGIMKNILSHFTEDTSTDNFLRVFFKQCIPDIACVAFLYLFSFSFVNYIATDIILAFLGFRFGLYAYLCIAAPLSVTLTFASVALKAVLICAILIYSCKIAICSLDLKKMLPNGRVSINGKVFVSITMSAVSTIGVTLIIYWLYCLI